MPALPCRRYASSVFAIYFADILHIYYAAALPPRFAPCRRCADLPTPFTLRTTRPLSFTNTLRDAAADAADAASITLIARRRATRQKRMAPRRHAHALAARCRQPPPSCRAFRAPSRCRHYAYAAMPPRHVRRDVCLSACALS